MLDLQLDLCKKAIKYEPIKELYKSSLHQFKHSVAPTASIDNRGKFFDVFAAFEMSKDSYISVIVKAVELIFNQFLILRQ